MAALHRSRPACWPTNRATSPLGLLLVAMLAASSSAVGAEPSDRCRELAAAAAPAALAVCREAVAASPEDPELRRLLAGLEYRDGDPARSEQLWRSVLASEGWSAEAAHGLAMALARSGDRRRAEEVLREIARRDPSAASEGDLARFLLGSGRADEAAAVAASAALREPESCELEELWGESLAATGDDEGAARRFAAAVDLGCPPYRWTRLGPVPGRLDEPEYRRLLIPDELVAGLDGLDERELLRRFELLAPVMAPEAAPAIADQIVGRPEVAVQLAGLGLLAAVGGGALPAWERVLAADDLIVRKLALRRIHELDDPSFVPLLEARLERETLPGNRSLTALALGELLIEGGERDRGCGLLESIPPDDPSYPPARLALSELAEREGRYREALGHLERARAAAPEFGVDPEREARLRALAAGTAPDPVSAAAAEE